MSDAMPRRIQLRRTKGWRLPPGAVVVSRPGPFGNPWTVEAARKAGFTGTDAEVAALCASLFRNGMRQRLPVCEPILARLHELRGRDLACWCPPDQACHGDVLIEMANQPLVARA
jgi:hypothetical protein